MCVLLDHVNVTDAFEISDKSGVSIGFTPASETWWPWLDLMQTFVTLLEALVQFQIQIRTAKPLSLHVKIS